MKPTIIDMEVVETARKNAEAVLLKCGEEFRAAEKEFTADYDRRYAAVANEEISSANKPEDIARLKRKKATDLAELKADRKEAFNCQVRAAEFDDHGVVIRESLIDRWCEARAKYLTAELLKGIVKRDLNSDAEIQQLLLQAAQAEQGDGPKIELKTYMNSLIEDAKKSFATIDPLNNPLTKRTAVGVSARGMTRRELLRGVGSYAGVAAGFGALGGALLTFDGSEGRRRIKVDPATVAAGAGVGALLGAGYYGAAQLKEGVQALRASNKKFDADEFNRIAYRLSDVYFPLVADKTLGDAKDRITERVHAIGERVGAVAAQATELAETGKTACGFKTQIDALQNELLAANNIALEINDSAKDTRVMIGHMRKADTLYATIEREFPSLLAEAHALVTPPQFEQHPLVHNLQELMNEVWFCRKSLEVAVKQVTTIGQTQR